MLCQSFRSSDLESFALMSLSKTHRLAGAYTDEPEDWEVAPVLVLASPLLHLQHFAPIVHFSSRPNFFLHFQPKVPPILPSKNGARENGRSDHVKTAPRTTKQHYFKKWTKLKTNFESKLSALSWDGAASVDTHMKSPTSVFAMPKDDAFEIPTCPSPVGYSQNNSSQN